MAGELIGTYCLDERTLELESVQTTGFYGRYLAVDEAHSGHGYGRLLKQQAVAYVEQRTASLKTSQLFKKSTVVNQ
ncbi:MAG: GNAT family N-acetyltransferase [Pedobacter sp.]|nr:MAG: GNAT family N-acetyltransferase [Pedobacter sp.]